MKSDLTKEIVVGGASLLSIINLINPYVLPILGIAWESGKCLYEKANNKNVLYKNFYDYINFINKNHLIQENLKDPNLISGLISLYDFIMKQRFETKKLRAFGIFIGFVNSVDKQKFELERMYNILNLISSDAKTFISQTYNNSNYPERFDEGDSSNSVRLALLPLFKNVYEEDLGYELQSLGILKPYNNSFSAIKPYAYTTFGKDFIKLISGHI
jgi:hypothetical protein